MKPRNTWRIDPDDHYSAYNLLAGVRGPDNDDHSGLMELKRIVTSRIRSIVFCSADCAGSLDDAPLTPDDVKEVASICKRLDRRNQQGHFRTHLAEAVGASFKHPVWGGLAEQLIDALYG